MERKNIILHFILFMVCLDESNAAGKLCKFAEKFPGVGGSCYEAPKPETTEALTTPEQSHLTTTTPKPETTEALTTPEQSHLTTTTTDESTTVEELTTPEPVHFAAPWIVCSAGKPVHKDCKRCVTVCDVSDLKNCSLHCVCSKDYKQVAKICKSSEDTGCNITSLVQSTPGTCSNSKSEQTHQWNISDLSALYKEPKYPTNCKEVYEQSGMFLIKPAGASEPFKVYCENTTDGGGWTVFQRRLDGSVDFYRDWNEYKHGFGYMRREFWLGNEKLSYLTNQGNYELRVDLTDVNGVQYIAKYNLFRISDEGSKYTLTELGEYLPQSTPGNDSLAFHANMSFSTNDRDNDEDTMMHCATARHGAWWYSKCSGSDLESNLNGLYFTCAECTNGIMWGSIPNGGSNITYSEMKVRPVN
ncbi:fibrinogen-like protein A isoform X2 [Apostichopus japonicus]|uniref:fibrinogen-like protein A isoform X2 n=1 Tax=Stichopus japonicus TaxID=307972 RepID=UPI003AB13118